MKKGALGKLYVNGAILENACVNTECVWNCTHWKELYKNGCYMFADNNDCVSGKKSGFTSVNEAKEKGLI